VANFTNPPNVTPYAWQLIAAQRMGTDHKKTVVAQPGAGKTLAAFLAAMHCEARTMLVVCPAGRVSRQWRDMATACGGNARICGGPGEGTNKLAAATKEHLQHESADGRPRVAIVPWSRLSRPADAKALLAAFDSRTIRPVDFLAIDESHYAQNAESTTRGLTALGGKAKQARTTTAGLRNYARRVMGLTGTPSTADPKKLRAQLLCAGLDDTATELKSKYAFERRYWGGRMEYNHGARRQIWTCEDVPSDPEGLDILMSKGLLRVSPADLAAQLPAHRRTLVNGFKAGAPAPAALEAWADACEAGTASAAILPDLSEIAALRSEATAARAADIAEEVASWHGQAEPGRCFLVWAVYHESCRALEEAIVAAIAKATKRGDCSPLPAGVAPVAVYHGGKTERIRARTLANAQAGNIRCLILTHASAGTGLDGLQHVADQALMAEAPPNPGQAEQTEGRIYRTGQTRPVSSRWVNTGIESTILRAAGVKAEALEAAQTAVETIEMTAPTDAPDPQESAPEATARAEPEDAPDPQESAPEATARAEPEDALAQSWSWMKDSRTGEFMAVCGYDCTRQADAWQGQIVAVTSKASGKVTRKVLASLKWAGTTKAGKPFCMWLTDWPKQTGGGGS